jgi:hypothetical protein
MKYTTLTFFALQFSLLAPLSAQFTLRSAHINPPGADNGYEYVEISGPASTALTNIWLIVIDGDGNASGQIDQAINLSSLSTGSNGLLLLRDASNAYTPSPSPETTIHVSDFNPDLENGTSTYALVTNFTGAVNDDVDTNNDGTLNTTVPWASAINSVAVTDGTSGDAQYADELAGTNLPDISGSEFDGFAIMDGVLYAIDIQATPTPPLGGPYPVQTAWDATGTTASSLVGRFLSPGNTTAPLPISLESFDVAVNRSAAFVHLTWATSSERNNQYFEVTRSNDGRNFAVIGKVNGALNSQTIQRYSFEDQKPVSGTNYYRLRQVDTDGQSSYSPIRSVVLGSTNELLVYPAPVRDQLNIRLEEAFVTDAQWQIVDMAGRIISEGQLAAEQTEQSISTESMSEGLYVLRVVAGQQVLTQQFKK